MSHVSNKTTHHIIDHSHLSRPKTEASPFLEIQNTEKLLSAHLPEAEISYFPDKSGEINTKSGDGIHFKQNQDQIEIEHKICSTTQEEETKIEVIHRACGEVSPNLKDCFLPPEDIQMILPKNSSPSPKTKNREKKIEPASFSHKTPSSSTRNLKDQWFVDFPWLQQTYSMKLKRDALFCSICINHGGKGPFAEDGSINYRRSALLEHGCSQVHSECIENRAKNKRLDDIIEDFRKKEGTRDEVLVQVAKFIANEGLAIRKFAPLLCLIDNILDILKINNGFGIMSDRYNNNYGASEFIHSLSELTRQSIIRKILASPYFGLSCDESTDVTGDKYLIIYITYFDEKMYNCLVSYLGLLELNALDAGSLEKKLMDYLSLLKLPLDKLIGMATDGANVMVGNTNGLTTRITNNLNRQLICTHCAAHRLALACSNSADAEKYFENFDKTLQAVYNYYKNSFVNAKNFEQLKDKLGVTKIPEIKRFVRTRWLSRFEVISSLYQNLDVIFADLESNYSKCRVAKQKKKSQSYVNEHKNEDNFSSLQKGLRKDIFKLEFLGMVCFLHDLLQEISRLQLLFQDSDLMIWDIDSSIQVFIVRLRMQYMQDEISPDPTLEAFLKEITFDSSKNLFKFRNIYITSVGSSSAHLKEIIKKYCHFLDKELNLLFPFVEKIRNFSILNVAKLNSYVTGYTRKDEALYEEEEVASYGIEELKYIHHYIKYEMSDQVLTDDFKEVEKEWRGIKFILIREFLRKKQDSKTVWKSFFNIPAYELMYPNFFRIVLAVMVIPVQTADCERGFSRMNLIKTDLRNRMSENSFFNFLFF
jgi:hypothetical protein